MQAKAPADASVQDRLRMHNLAMDLVLLAQGVPFFHAGDELLRSKSLDRNSYNSGDWFNKLDFTYTSNNWTVACRRPATTAIAGRSSGRCWRTRR